jgi:polyhydroxyalkanoate synthesis repressor PhaR
MLDIHDALRYLLGVDKAAPAAERVIKRYDNRKLYDPQARRYVTLGDLAGMVAGGLEVRVLDQRTGEDLTAAVLAQVILEGIKEHTASIPRQVLSRLIRLGVKGAERWGRWMGPQEAAARARSEAERIVEGLIARGRLTLEEALGLRQEIASTVQRLVTEAQQGLEERIRGLLDHSEREGGVNPTLQSFKERLLAFEAYLDDTPPRRGRRGAPAPARRGRR